MSPPDLVVAGNLIVDDLVFEDGRTRLGEPGGAVLYAALGAALWGLRVGVVSLRGDDYPAWALDGLAGRGVALDGVRAFDRPGVRAWLLHEGGRRQIVHRIGRPTHAQASPGIEHVPAAWLTAPLFHLTPTPLDEQRALVAGLRQRGAAFIALDPHVPLSEETLPAWRGVLPLLDALFVGVDELGLPGPEDAAAARLRDLAGGRLRLVACKRGERGGQLIDAHHARTHTWTAAAATPVDPTGAGDAFAGGFLAGRLLGDDLDAALRRGAVSAAFAVEDWGARGLLAATREAAERRLTGAAPAPRARVGDAAGEPPLALADGVTAALRDGRPLVGLETTLVTHGLPRPEGLQVALALEDEVRAAGAWPATIGVLDGRLCVGLTRAQLERLATSPDAVKLSLGNLAAQVASGAPGSTTVAATLFAAWRAGLRVCATGGMGGVHRGAGESDDVSADLTALARFPVALVCSGAKAVLDLPRTLERLETLGVPVYGFGSDRLPAFYRRDSGLPVDRRFDAVDALAAALRAHAALGLGTGVVIGQPIPHEHELPEDVCRAALDAALAEAEREGLRGRDVTPFLLERLRVLTQGRSLTANVALLRANARLAARLAVALRV
jgi:pseudouridine-5'-phosphate glycosidase